MINLILNILFVMIVGSSAIYVEYGLSLQEYNKLPGFIVISLILSIFS